MENVIMDEFVEESLETVEFLSFRKENNHCTVKDASCGTSWLPEFIDNFTQTNPKQHKEVQTTESIPTKYAECDDKQLAIWLKQIYPLVEEELLEGLTPFYHDENLKNSEISLIPYQELTLEKLPRNTKSVSVAAWLSTRIGNIPSLVLSSSFIHDGWCEHLDQSISLYVPRRVKNENFIGFTEKQTIPVKACIRFLKTNIFNKDTFIGITESCDLIVWEYIHSSNTEEVKEIASATVSYDSVVAVDWLEVNKALTIHSDGTVSLWNISKTVFIESRYKIGTAADITAAIALNSSQFLAGSNKGRLLYCSMAPSTSTLKFTEEREIPCIELRQHASSVAFLFRGKLKDMETVVTVDISGELFLHDVRHLEDGPLLVFKIPLPFKNSVMTPKDVAHIFTRGYESGLEIYRLLDGRTCFRTSSATGMEHFMQLSDNGVLLFPRVNNYRRFLVHKVCEDIATHHDLVTFSIGQGVSRRTIVCFKKQLLLPLEKLEEKKSNKGSKSNNYTYKCSSPLTSWRSAPKMVSEKDIKENVTKNKTENLYELPTAGNVQSSNIRTRSRDGLRPSNSLPLERQGNDATFKERNTDQPNVKNERVVRKERRPDRAVYVPKAGRSQSASEQKNQTNPKTNGTVQSNESGKTSQSDCYQEQILGNDAQIAADCFKDMAALSMKDEDSTYRRNDYENKRSRKGLARHTKDEPYKDCDTSVKENISTTRPSDLERNQHTSQPNTNNTNAMQNNPQQDNKTALIESVICPPKEFEDDKEIIELEKMSKEINRSSRRIVKQTFNSDVLKIPDTVLSTDIEQYSELSKNKPDSDDWDTMFDDNGDCLNPDIMAELTATVGKVKIERPKADYKAYLVKQAILNEEEYPHVLEVSNFPVEFKTQDLMMVFSAYKESGFDIKWVDDTHALVVFSSSRIAAEVLSMSHPFVNLKPLADATAESKAKARKCAESLQPYRPRPETCAALARRLVSGALGVRLKTAAEERENEKKILREAKERKLLAAKQRDEVWES